MISAKLEGPRGMYFGAGIRNRMADLVSEYGEKVILVVGAHSLRDGGHEEELLAQIQGREVLTVRCPPGEPTVEGVQVLRTGLAGFSADVIVAAGGGSVLDTAKALAGTMRRDEDLLDFLEGIGRGVPVDRNTIPWIALPTTAGTGSEATKNAVIKSIDHGVKKSIRSVNLYADYALVDPELTLGVPARLTGMTGMDALTQLLESYVTIKGNPLVRALVRDVVVPTLDALEKLIGSPQDLEARTTVAFGSMVSGIALANSGLGAVHGFASGLGGSSEIPHGLICALFLAPVLRFNSDHIRYDVEAIVGRKSDSLDHLLARVEGLVEAYGLAEEMGRYRLDPNQIPLIASRSAGSSMSGNPVEMSQKDKEALLREVF